jgi:uncharacterized BrkB/YihY/UPF0761 family membrane protein
VEEPEADHKRSVKERGTEAVARARARAEELRLRAEANRPRSRLVDIAFGSYERDTEVGGGILAGAVAFRVFLFIVPFVFFVVVAFGLAADATGMTPASAADKAGIVGLLATTIENVGDQSVWSRLTILAISGFALVLGARNLIKVMTVIHVLIWRVPRVRVRRQVRAVALLLVSVLGALVLAQLTSKLQDRSFPAWVFATSVFMLIPAGLWLLASLKVFPHPPDVSWRDMLPGALLVGVGIEALHVFTVVYISHSFERKSETYGALGGSLSLLLWAYVVGRILAASPVINAVVWRRTHAHQLPPPVVSNLPPPVVPDRPLPSAPSEPRLVVPAPNAPVPTAPAPAAAGPAAPGPTSLLPPPSALVPVDTSAREPAVLPPPSAPAVPTAPVPPPPTSPFAPGDDALPPPRAAGDGGALPPPVAPANGVLLRPTSAGNGRAPSPAVPARSAGAALPPPLAPTVVGPPVAASRDAPPPLRVPVPPG